MLDTILDCTAGPQGLRGWLLRAKRAQREYDSESSAIRIHGGLIVKAYRDTFGLTQRQFATGFGIHPTYVSKLENDRTPLPVKLAVRMAKTFDEMDGKVNLLAPAHRPARKESVGA